MEKNLKQYLLTLDESEAKSGIHNGNKETYLEVCSMLQQLARDGERIPMNALRFYFYYGKHQMASKTGW
jgi:hypothetical protein